MIDFELGWRAVPGMLSRGDGETIQIAVKRVPPEHAVVELGAWCGRSLAAICEALPEEAVVYSIDNYQEDSQTIGDYCPLTAASAQKFRRMVNDHYQSLGRDVRCQVCESAQAGVEYRGVPVSVLFVDDHHSGEQVTKNLQAWVPCLAPQATVLFHDYHHRPYGIAEAVEKFLPPLNFNHIGTRAGSIISIWTRGYGEAY